jgi:hypothetical protein
MPKGPATAKIPKSTLKSEEFQQTSQARGVVVLTVVVVVVIMVVVVVLAVVVVVVELVVVVEVVLVVEVVVEVVAFVLVDVVFFVVVLVAVAFSIVISELKYLLSGGVCSIPVTIGIPPGVPLKPLPLVPLYKIVELLTISTAIPLSIGKPTHQQTRNVVTFSKIIPGHTLEEPSSPVLPWLPTVALWSHRTSSVFSFEPSMPQSRLGLTMRSRSKSVRLNPNTCIAKVSFALGHPGVAASSSRYLPKSS